MSTYSDGTMKIVKLQLSDKLKRMEGKLDKKEDTIRQLIADDVNLIEEKLEYRRTLRRFEKRLGFRKRRRFV